MWNDCITTSLPAKQCRQLVSWLCFTPFPCTSLSKHVATLGLCEHNCSEVSHYVNISSLSYVEASAQGMYIAFLLFKLRYFQLWCANAYNVEESLSVCIASYISTSRRKSWTFLRHPFSGIVNGAPHIKSPSMCRLPIINARLRFSCIIIIAC